MQARLLEQAHYYVLRATSVREAEEKLRERYVHLAILDIRVEDEEDQQDISGLLLVQNEEFHYIPKIILTAYPSWDYAKKALGVALAGRLVKMLDKTDGPQAILDAVEEGFERYLDINWELVIRWDERERLSLPHLVTLLDPGLSSGPYLSHRVNELEDLLRRLFHDSYQINVARLFSHKDGRLFLGVFAYARETKRPYHDDDGQEGEYNEVFAYTRESERQYLVACGHKGAIVGEHGRYESLVPDSGGFGSVRQTRHVETAHFAATAYVLNAADLEEIVTFAEFYQHHGVEQIVSALNNLFTKTLEPWHKRDWSRSDVRTLADVTRYVLGISEDDVLTRTNVEKCLQGLCEEILQSGLLPIAYAPNKLSMYLFESDPLSLPNPLNCLTNEQVAFLEPLLCSTVHGRLSGNSILANREGDTWVIDFGNVRHAPLIQDFISLEIAVRSELLNITDMQIIYEMERRLVEIDHHDKTVDCTGLGEECVKAIRTIIKIRQLSGKNAQPDVRAYFIGLFYGLVAHLLTYKLEVRHRRRELIPYFHCLLSAAMLCKKLLPTVPAELPLQAMYSLWLDEDNREAWVEGNQVALTPQDFDLLLCLYRQKGRLCSRVAIAEQVFKVAFDGSEQEKKEIEEIEGGRINAAISRLRQKITAHSSGHNYVTAVRGEGYRLDLREFTEKRE